MQICQIIFTIFIIWRLHAGITGGIKTAISKYKLDTNFGLLLVSLSNDITSIVLIIKVLITPALWLHYLAIAGIVFIIELILTIVIALIADSK